MSTGGFDVVGGAHDIEADIDDMEATGAQIRRTGLDVGDIAVRAHAVILDANLLTSAPLSPGSFADAEGAVLGALDGGGGLSQHAIEMTAAGLTMQGRAQAWYLFDQAQEFGEETRHWAQGKLGLAALTPAGLGITALLLWGDGAFEDPEGYLVSHPDLVEEIVASSPFALNILGGGVYPTSVAQAASMIAALYDNGEATVRQVDDGLPSRPPPTSMSRSLRALDSFDEPGMFQIQMTTGPDGEPLYNVYLPGTKQFDAPWDESGLIQNMGTNLAAVAGVDNAYEDAVIQALAQADVPSNARIMLTGHSQGGIVAVRLAEKLTDPGSGYPQYNVSNVVTAGSPVDHIEVPESVQVLSLVNEYDVVARLDGEKYDDSSNHTTIVTHNQTDSVTGNHMLRDTYVPMADSLDTSSDPAVRDAVDPLDDTFYNPSGQQKTWEFLMERQ